MDPAELLDISVSAARRAGDLLLDHFGGSASGVESKSTPTDLVSDADRAAEGLLVASIRAARPNDGILAEEGAEGSSDSGLRWVIDPLDATINFLFRIPHWCVALAVEDERGTLVATIHDPNRAETFTAVRGGAAHLNGNVISVSERAEISKALIGTGFSYRSDVRAVQGARVGRLLPQVRDVRRAGSASLDLAWLACGRLDGFFESPLEAWDRVPGTLIVREAGGVVSELPAPFDEPAGVVASGPAIHDALCKLVREED